MFNDDELEPVEQEKKEAKLRVQDCTKEIESTMASRNEAFEEMKKMLKLLKV